MYDNGDNWADVVARCKLCGEPMPVGEEMFECHGYSCDCPKPPLERPTEGERFTNWLNRLPADAQDPPTLWDAWQAAIASRKE